MEFGSAVILAGGKSSRMGFDKQFLRRSNSYLLHSHGETLSSLFDQVIVVTNRPEFYADSRFTVVSDEIPGQGPLSGIHVGLKTARSRHVYLLACDMPYIHLEYVRYMHRRMSLTNAEICVTRRADRLEPFNAFYARSLVSDIETYLTQGRHSLFRFIAEHDACYIPEEDALRFSADWEMFLNLNTRQDLEKWRDQGVQQAGG